MNERTNERTNERMNGQATGRVWALEGAKFIARLKNSRTGLGVRSLIQVCTPWIYTTENYLRPLLFLIVFVYTLLKIYDNPLDMLLTHHLNVSLIQYLADMVCVTQSEFRLNLVMAQGGHGEGLLGPRKLNEPSALIELTLAGTVDIYFQTHTTTTHIHRQTYHYTLIISYKHSL